MDVPLADHLLSVIRANDDRYEQRFKSQEKAIDKAEAAVERRLEGQNEWREQSAQRERDFMPRREHEAFITAQAALNADHSSRLDKLEGTHSGTSQAIAWAATAFATFIAVASIVVAIVVR